jgi:hypothetical protein
MDRLGMASGALLAFSDLCNGAILPIGAEAAGR